MRLVNIPRKFRNKLHGKRVRGTFYIKGRSGKRSKGRFSTCWEPPSKCTTKIDYDLYIQSPKWQEVRKRLSKRKKKGCHCCKRKGSLDLHHVTYDRLGKELDSDLVWCCRQCHE